jgi:hypothetical protein
MRITGSSGNLGAMSVQGGQKEDTPSYQKNFIWEESFIHASTAFAALKWNCN